MEELSPFEADGESGGGGGERGAAVVEREATGSSVQSLDESPTASVSGREDPGRWTAAIEEGATSSGRGAAAIEGGATASCCKPSVGGVAFWMGAGFVKTTLMLERAIWTEQGWPGGCCQSDFTMVGLIGATHLKETHLEVE